MKIILETILKNYLNSNLSKRDKTPNPTQIFAQGFYRKNLEIAKKDKRKNLNKKYAKNWQKNVHLKFRITF